MIEFTAWGVHLKIWASQIVGIVATALFVWILWRANNDEANPVKFSTMLVWPGTQQTSLALLGTLTGIMTSTWIIIDLALRGRLTPEYFLAYIGTLVFGKGATEAINAWRDRGPPPPATNTTQNIDKAAVVSSAPAPIPPPPVPPNAPPIAPPVTPRARKRPKPKGRRK